MNDDTPGIGVTFGIDFGNAFGGLKTLDDLIGKTAADAVRSFAAMEQEVAGGLGLPEASRQFQALTRETAATQRELRTAAQETRKVEQAGEALVRQLERQNATFGMSREQLRGLKAENAALAAEQRGLTELAQRIRSQEAGLAAQEVANQRRIAAEVRAAAEAKALAAQQAVAAAAAEAQARREATLAHGAFEAAARRGIQALREQEAVARSNALAVHAQQMREAAHAHGAFEAAARRGIEAMRRQEAAEASLAAETRALRSALDPMFAAQQRFDNELTRAERLLAAGTITQREYTQAVALARTTLQNHATAVAGVGSAATRTAQQQQAAAAAMGANRQAMAGLSFQAQDTFTQLSMGANAFSVLAIQGGQAAGMMMTMEGRAGSFARFMLGPWGLAITAGMLVVGALTKGMFDNSEAAKEAEAAMKKFQDRQSDIGNFIDDTTGRLKEQNRTLILNATLARQAQIAANAAAIGESRNKAFAAAREGATRTVYDPERRLGGNGGQEVLDPAVAKLIQQSAGDVDKLATGLGSLAARRPELAKVALEVSGIGGQAVLAARENEKLRAELRALGGQTSVVGRETTGLIAKQVALATATTPVARARAELALVQERATAADKAGGVALTQYRHDLTAATQAVNAAEAAERSATAGRRLASREAREAVREAAKAQKEWDKVLDSLNLTTGARDAEFAQILQRASTARANMGQTFREIMGEDTFSAMDDALARADEAQRERVNAWGENMRGQAATITELFDAIDTTGQSVAENMASAFGRAGGAIGDAMAAATGYAAQQYRLTREHQAALADANGDQQRIEREELAFALRSGQLRTEAMLGVTGAAKGLFREHSAGYRAMEAAEKALTVVQLARTAIDVAGGAARMFATLGPLGFPAVAAMGAVMASLGFSIASGGGAGTLPASNAGTGSILGDPTGQSESIRRSIDALREVDDLTATHTREMAASLRTIESSIGGVAAQLVRAGSLNASAGVVEGFNTNAVGSVLKAIVPLFGGMLSGLFGTKTTVTGGGLYADARTVGDILGGGFDAGTYSDVEKVKKFLGITTGRSTSTVYGGSAGGEVNDQFTLILRSFSDAIGAAAGPLGESTDAIAARVSGFVFNLGRIDLKGVTGTEIEEKLTAMFGAAADGMAATAFPGIQRFQRVGEGAFETLARVATTVEAVTLSLDQLGTSARGLGIDAKMGLAGQFDSIGDLTGAADAYFASYFTKAEQNAARLAQLGGAFDAIGLAMPATLGSFRALVEAQDLTSAAGQRTFATLLQLAPAFADLQAAMTGAKSAADVLAERGDLERKLLELAGDTAALRALDLAKVDASNRALQQQVWAMEDGQAAAKAADELRKAWGSVGDSIMEEVRRIRGLTDTASGGGFASLMGQFNAATIAARAGDQDIAKTLPGLSKALLDAAADAATSQQELDRVRAETAASLEATYGLVGALGRAAVPANAVPAAAVTAAAAAPSSSAATDLREQWREVAAELREELANMRRENTATGAAIAGNTGRMARIMEDVTSASGGDAVSIANGA